MTLNNPYCTSKAARVMFSMKSLNIPPPSIPASSTPNSLTKVTRICKAAKGNHSQIEGGLTLPLKTRKEGMNNKYENMPKKRILPILEDYLLSTGSFDYKHLPKYDLVVS